MVNEESKSDVEIVRKKCQDVLMEVIGMVHTTDERHLEAVKHLLKGAVALKSTLESMKNNLDVVKLDPVLKIASGKKIEQQRRFYSTIKRKRKINVRFAKPTDTDKERFMSFEAFGEAATNDNGINTESKSKVTKLSKGKLGENTFLPRQFLIGKIIQRVCSKK